MQKSRDRKSSFRVLDKVLLERYRYSTPYSLYAEKLFFPVDTVKHFSCKYSRKHFSHTSGWPFLTATFAFGAWFSHRSCYRLVLHVKLKLQYRFTNRGTAPISSNPGSHLWCVHSSSTPEDLANLSQTNGKN